MNTRSDFQMDLLRVYILDICKEATGVTIAIEASRMLWLKKIQFLLMIAFLWQYKVGRISWKESIENKPRKCMKFPEYD